MNTLPLLLCSTSSSISWLPFRLQELPPSLANCTLAGFVIRICYPFPESQEKKMLHLKRFRIALLCLFVAFSGLSGGEKAWSQAASPSSFALTLLHTNDLHGHIFPFAYTEIGRSKEEKASVGGAARRATLVRKLRRDIKNPVLLVDSGDTFTRGPLTNAYEGIADAEAMNAVGYNLAALGNNEFKAKDGREDHDAQGAQEIGRAHV